MNRLVLNFTNSYQIILMCLCDFYVVLKKLVHISKNLSDCINLKLKCKILSLCPYQITS